jgi:transcriptional regulator with XRE-family HTH domain
MTQADEFILKLGKVIQSHRKALGLSQEELAEKAGLHRTYIGAIERGERNITLKNFYRVTLALGANISSLFSEIE